ncbi:unnamed protein product [Medioppia subpectinata]|uniref:Rieske domain-containing protein n=1 Tax=Medioppia subpectinata TaxID=1979941 RepID=A0A7R9KEH1_9ACAR|nr:unnamed protein product [Medioppia subpectinata]CAG2101686.1 unnamed protein product [Medioppia subpectinata]
MYPYIHEIKILSLQRLPNSELKAVNPVVRKWPTIERNELIYVWHHSEDSEPDHYPEDFVAKYGHKLSLKGSHTRLMDSNFDVNISLVLEQAKYTSHEQTCPFHGWRFGGDGQCKRIPNLNDSELKAVKAVVKKWPTIERNELIYVWYHSEDSAPDHYPVDFVAKYGHKLSLKGSHTRLMDSNFDVATENAVDLEHVNYRHTSIIPFITSLKFSFDTKYGSENEMAGRLTICLLGIELVTVPMRLCHVSPVLVAMMIGEDNAMLGPVDSDIVIWVNLQKQKRPIFTRNDALIVCTKFSFDTTYGSENETAGRLTICLLGIELVTVSIRLCHVSPVLVALLIGDDDSMLGPVLALAATVPFAPWSNTSEINCVPQANYVDSGMVIWVNLQKPKYPILTRNDKLIVWYWRYHKRCYTHIN